MIHFSWRPDLIHQGFCAKNECLSSLGSCCFARRGEGKKKKKATGFGGERKWAESLRKKKVHFKRRDRRCRAATFSSSADGMGHQLERPLTFNVTLYARNNSGTTHNLHPLHRLVTERKCVRCLHAFLHHLYMICFCWSASFT